MSRSGYVDDLPDNDLALYRGRVANTIKGKRSQAFLKEAATALDAMDDKRLFAGELIASDGGCCTIGAVAQLRGMTHSDVVELDSEDPEQVGGLVGISKIMAAEIEFENDEGTFHNETPEQRWKRMRKWIERNIRKDVS